MGERRGLVAKSGCNGIVVDECRRECGRDCGERIDGGAVIWNGPVGIVYSEISKRDVEVGVVEVGEREVVGLGEWRVGGEDEGGCRDIDFHC